MALDKERLHTLFAEGKTDQEIGKELGRVASTINYHRRLWEKSGRPGMQAPVLAEEPVVVVSTLGEATALLAAAQAPTVEPEPASEPEPAAPPAAEALPEVGQVYEGVVDKVDRNFALVNLVQFYDGAKWIRGKVHLPHILRRGVCRDVTKWLHIGDTVNVKVLRLEESSGVGYARWRVDLSIREAPAHPGERLVLEERANHPRGAEEPIIARGSEVAAGLDVDETDDHRLSGKLARRPSTEKVVRLNNAPIPSIVPVELKGPPGPDPDMLSQELDKARNSIHQLQEELTNVRAELADIRHQRDYYQVGFNRLQEDLATTQAELARASEAAGKVQSICDSCWRRTDVFAPCPYANACGGYYVLPEESLYDHHKDECIKFSPRGVVECPFYLPAKEA